MSAPPPLQIREANAHLAAVHRRAAELEARLEAAECTVRAQAERLARHDQQLSAALDELGRAKDREIAALREQLLTSEAAVQSLQAAVRQRDKLIGQLQPRAELLQDLCRRRPPLAGLLATLAEAERLGPLPASDPLPWWAQLTPCQQYWGRKRTGTSSTPQCLGPLCESQRAGSGMEKEDSSGTSSTAWLSLGLRYPREDPLEEP